MRSRPRCPDRARQGSTADVELEKGIEPLTSSLLWTPYTHGFQRPARQRASGIGGTRTAQRATPCRRAGRGVRDGRCVAGIAQGRLRFREPCVSAVECGRHLWSPAPGDRRTSTVRGRSARRKGWGSRVRPRVPDANHRALEHPHVAVLAVLGRLRLEVLAQLQSGIFGENASVIMAATSSAESLDRRFTRLVKNLNASLTALREVPVDEELPRHGTRPSSVTRSSNCWATPGAACGVGDGCSACRVQASSTARFAASGARYFRPYRCFAMLPKVWSTCSADASGEMCHDRLRVLLTVRRDAPVLG